MIFYTAVAEWKQYKTWEFTETRVIRLLVEPRQQNKILPALHNYF